MDIVIISQYLRDIESFQNNNSRFVYLAKLLAKFDENEVEIITSDFNHSAKRHFSKIGELHNVKISPMHECGYSRNVSLKRFSSHKELARNIRDYLDKRTKPDVCYCAIPSLAVGNVVAEYCRKNNVRFIIDIQDLWPEAFKMVLSIPILSDLLFAPMKKKANKIYGQADAVVAVSNAYVERAIRSNKKLKSGQVVFLGTDLSVFDINVKSNVFEKHGEYWIGYCGTLGASYDLTCVFDALKIIQNKGGKLPKFVIMGDGPRKVEFEKYAKEKRLDVLFVGKLAYDKMCGLLCNCDIVVNPIVKKSAASIINKHADYAASGIPVINTQECLEYRELIEKYNMGFNCKNGNANEIAEKIELLLQNEELRIEQGSNARRCAEELFDRKITYTKIYELILNKS